MGPLGLDPIHLWAQSENRDPTIGTVCGKLLNGAQFWVLLTPCAWPVPPSEARSLRI